MTNIVLGQIISSLKFNISFNRDAILLPTTDQQMKEFYTREIESCEQALEIINKQTPTRVSVMVEGGVVQSAISNDPTALVDLYDLDESSYSSPEEQEEVRITRANWDLLCENPLNYGIF